MRPGYSRALSLWRRGVSALVVEQPALARQAAAIAGQGAVRADHPMAGHDDGDRIGAVGEADRAARVGAPQLRREFAIGRRRAGWSGSQCRPYAALEKRA